MEKVKNLDEINPYDLEEAELLRIDDMRAEGILIEKTSCCGVPVKQSQGAHDIGRGRYVGGVIADYCPECHRPYNDPIIGSVQ